MKNKILALGLVLALVAAMVIPMAVSAAGTVVVSGQVGDIPTVSSTSPTHINADPTNPESQTVTITGTNFDSGATYTVTVAGSGVTCGTVTWISTTSISCDFTVAAGTTSGLRNVTVDESGQQGVLTSTKPNGFYVGSYYTINAPTGFSLGFMTMNSTTTNNTSPAAGSLVTNDTTWTVTARDTDATATAGKMVSGSYSPAAKFQIGRTSGTVANSDGTPAITYTQDTDPTKALPFYVSQAIATGDHVGSYTITITFTGSAQY